METAIAPLIPFAAYMEQALYGLDGYYASGRARSGREGDYFTAPDVGPVFGQLLAAQLLEWQKRLNLSPFHLVEVGPGEGKLAKNIRAHGDVPYIAVERSPARQKILREIPGLQVVSDLGALPDQPLSGCIFANELIDAFPVHRVRQDNGTLEEAYVSDGQWVWRAPSTPRLQAYLDRIGVKLPEGYVTEVNLAMGDWIRQAAAALSRGVILIIDYGRPAWDYYALERNHGTLRTFGDHRVGENFLEKGVDITADVDFSSFALDAQDAGLTLLAYMELGSFLVQTVALRPDLRGSRGLRYLFHPEGMGSAFQVLILSKGVTLDFEHNRLSRLGLKRR